MEDDKVWPPAPKRTLESEPNSPAEGKPPSKPFLPVILIMWALTALQLVIKQLLGIVGPFRMQMVRGFGQAQIVAALGIAGLILKARKRRSVA